MQIDWKALFKKLLPHLLIVLAFFAFTFIYLSPMLQGKVLPQNDITQWKGSFQETKEFMEQTGERTLWTNSMFGGMPTYQIAPWSPNSILGLRYVYNILLGGWSLPMPANAIFAYCLGFYLLLLAFRLNPWLSAIGAIAYALSSFNIIILEAGHMLQAYALATGPAVIAAVVFTMRTRKYLLGGALFSVALGFHIASNHPQISYYTALVLILYFVFEFFSYLREKQLAHFFKACAIFAVGAVLAVGANITYQLTTLEYTKTTIRGPSELTQSVDVKSSGLDKDYAFDWSNAVGEVLTVFIPDIRGGETGAIGNESKDALNSLDPQMQQIVGQFDQYWGEQPFQSGPAYYGAVIFFLFVLGMFYLKGPLKWWALSVTILSMALSMGANMTGGFIDSLAGSFNDFMFYKFPLYNKFRSVSFTLVMGAMVVPLIAMLTVDKILREPPVWNKEAKRKFYIALAITAGFALIVYLSPSIAGDHLKPETVENTNVSPDRSQLEQANLQENQIQMVLDGLQEARMNITQADAGRTLIFVLLAAALLFFYLMKSYPMKWLIAGLGLLILVDMWTVDKRYLNADKFERKTNAEDSRLIASSADEAILQDPDPNYRVINIATNTFNDATTSYFHKSVGGYHGAKLRRFQEMRERYLDQLISIMKQNLQQIPGPQLLGMLQEGRRLSILNMLNTRYIITGSRPENVILNPYALNDAWFIKQVKMVPDADTEIAALDSFVPAETVIVDKRFADYMNGFKGGSDDGSITMTDYRPNHLSYKSNSSSEQFAVFSEMYYNSGLGWEAYVDGKPEEHIRVNYVLRGMRVPAGDHVIEFKFEPQSFKTGEIISLICSLLLLLYLIGAIVYEMRKSNEPEGRMV